MYRTTPAIQRKFDNLRESAHPYTVEFSCSPNIVPKPLVTIELSHGMQVDGVLTDVLKAVRAGLLSEFEATLTWAEARQLRFVPGEWCGSKHFYSFVTHLGVPVSLSSECSEEDLDKRMALAYMAAMRRVLSVKGFAIKTRGWRGLSSQYSYLDEHGHEFREQGDVLVTTGHDTKKKKARVEKPTGKGLEIHSEEATGSVLYGMPYRKQPGAMAHYFSLPDGTGVEATWRKMLDVVDSILDAKLTRGLNADEIEVSDCVPLRKLLIATAH